MMAVMCTISSESELSFGVTGGLASVSGLGSGRAGAGDSLQDPPLGVFIDLKQSLASVH